MEREIFIINGGPRKDENTAKMCESFKEGIESADGKAEIINLYDIDFKGCRSCFACKLKGGKNYGKCAWPDGLKEILKKVSNGDGIVFASPIYFGDVTGVMKSFLERLLFPFVAYSDGFAPIPPKKLDTAVIYTMNVNEETFLNSYIAKDNIGPVGFFENWIEHVYKRPERVCAFDTYQFKDYDKYVADIWDEKAKMKHRTEVFPNDLKAAFDLGAKMAKGL